MLYQTRNIGKALFSTDPRSSVSPVILLVKSSVSNKRAESTPNTSRPSLAFDPQHRSIPLSCLPWQHTESALYTIPHHNRHASPLFVTTPSRLQDSPSCIPGTGTAYCTEAFTGFLDGLPLRFPLRLPITLSIEAIYASNGT